MPDISVKTLEKAGWEIELNLVTKIDVRGQLTVSNVYDV